MRNALASIIIAFCTLFSIDALAADKDETIASNPDWYGWEYLAADVGGASLLVYARAASPAPLAESWLYRDGRRYPIGSEFTTSAGAIGSSIYLGGGPLAHLANGAPANGAVSLASRALIPLLLVQIVEPIGGTVGFFVRSKNGQPAHCHGGGLCIDFEQGSFADAGSLVGADVGFFSGVLTAMLVDQLALSRHRLGERAPRKQSAIDLAPDLRLSKDAAFAGVGGRF